MLLILTNKRDLACDYLILKLREHEIRYKRVNIEDLSASFQITITLSSDTCWYEITFPDGSSVTRENTSAVYFRQPVEPSLISEVLPDHRTFARREVLETLRSLWRVIDERLWLNHPKNLWLAGNKIEQLRIASELGLRVPETCLTLSEQDAREFIDRCNGRAVAKAVKHGFVRDQSTIHVATTQRITPALLEEWEEFSTVPVILQREIPKQYDVRVIVVDNHVFPTAIFSQEHEETTVDWRLWDLHDFDLRHEKLVLPDELEHACRTITKHFGLRYSAIDMIHGTDGQYYFLELNPNGQWAWIEQKVGFPIRESIIDCLGLRDE